MAYAVERAKELAAFKQELRRLEQDAHNKGWNIYTSTFLSSEEHVSFLQRLLESNIPPPETGDVCIFVADRFEVNEVGAFIDHGESIATICEFLTGGEDVVKRLIAGSELKREQTAKARMIDAIVTSMSK